MKVIVLFVATVVSFSNSGCGSNAKSDSVTEAEAPISKGDQKTKKVSDPNAIKARELLKASLDSWVFDDSEESWEKSHPNVDILDERSSVMPFDLSIKFTRPAGSYPRIKLLKYEIGLSRNTSRKVKPVSYEFVVTLHAQDIHGNDIKRNQNYTVDRINGKWTIIRYSK